MSSPWRVDTPEVVVFMGGGESWNYDQEMKILYQNACIYIYITYIYIYIHIYVYIITRCVRCVSCHLSRDLRRQ